MHYKLGNKFFNISINKFSHKMKIDCFGAENQSTNFAISPKKSVFQKPDHTY